MPYKAEKRLYLNSDGKVVEEGDPSAASLLADEGDTIPLADARKYGLVGEDEDDSPDPAAKALRAAPENKAVEGPKETK